MAWSSQPTATLRIRKAGSSEYLSFVGVSSDDSAGTPDDFLNAANHILEIAGMSAIKGGMTRTIKQEVNE